MKKCSTCLMELPATREFFYNETPTLMRARCRQCGMAADKRHYHSLSPEEKARRNRRKNLLTQFRLTPDQYDAILEAQGGVCAVCSTPKSGGRGKAFAVDHDHACCTGRRSCGKCIRGLLCANCNCGIGHFKDSPELLGLAASCITTTGVSC